MQLTYNTKTNENKMHIGKIHLLFCAKLATSSCEYNNTMPCQLSCYVKSPMFEFL